VRPQLHTMLDRRGGGWYHDCECSGMGVATAGQERTEPTVESLSAHRFLILSVFVPVLAISLSLLYYRKKQSLLREINEVLAMCRGTDSWRSKSEFRLAPSLEGIEGELDRRSLFALVRIRHKVWRHYRVHSEKDDQHH
jgi:hypothetical protein